MGTSHRPDLYRWTFLGNTVGCSNTFPRFLDAPDTSQNSWTRGTPHPPASSDFVLGGETGLLAVLSHMQNEIWLLSKGFLGSVLLGAPSTE
jgi:hypothetical protein